MVQQEVIRKTRVYGSVAFLSAISLVALIYAFGVAPVIFNPNVSPIKTFSSYEELNNFVSTNTQSYTGPYYYVGALLTLKLSEKELLFQLLPKIPWAQAQKMATQPRTFKLLESTKPTS